MIKAAALAQFILMASLLTACSGLNIQYPSASDACSSFTPTFSRYDALGSGTTSDPYIICTPYQFKTLADTPAALTSNFKIGRDLDFAKFDGSTSSLTLKPIGDYDVATPANSISFTGRFDGGGHKLSNVQLSALAGKGVALFARTEGAYIHDLVLENVNVSGDQYVASLIAYNSSSLVKNIQVSGLVRATGSNSGGVMGYPDANGASSVANIDGVISTVNIAGNDASGGIVGWISSKSGAHADLSNIVFSGNLTESSASGNSYGGVAGVVRAETGATARASNIVVSGNVTLAIDGSFSGGVFGNVGGTGAGTDLSYDHVRMTGTLSSPSSFIYAPYALGGVVGLYDCAAQVMCTISNSSFEGQITLTSSSASPNAIGGLVGELNISSSPSLVAIRDSFSRGSIVYQNPNVANHGGLIGNIDNSAGSAYALLNRAYVSVTQTGLAGLQPAVAGNISGASIQASNVFYDSTLSPIATLPGSNFAIAGTTATASSAMLNSSTYVGFDFTNVWAMTNGVSLPTPR